MPADEHAELDRLVELAARELDELLAELETSEDDVDLLVQIGHRYLGVADFKTAEGYYQRALSADPSDPWTQLHMGNARYAQHKYRDGIRYFKIAVDTLSDVACPYWLLASAYEKLRDYNRAEWYYKKAVAVEPDDRDAKRRLGEWIERNYGPE